MQFDRPLLKSQARGLIRTAVPRVLYASLIYTLLSALVSYLSARLVGVSLDVVDRLSQYLAEGRYEYALRLYESVRPTPAAWVINLALQLAITVVSAGFILFLLNTVRGTGAVYANLLDGFGMFFRVILLEIVTAVLVTLWSLLLVVPGIIAAYRYSMALYILLDHPEYGVMDCIRESKRMTQGYKWELFILDLSFLGWALLAGLPVAGWLVQLWFTPYISLTRILYYERLSGHVDSSVYTRPESF